MKKLCNWWKALVEKFHQWLDEEDDRFFNMANEGDDYE